MKSQRHWILGAGITALAMIVLYVALRWIIVALVFSGSNDGGLADAFILAFVISVVFTGGLLAGGAVVSFLLLRAFVSRNLSVVMPTAVIATTGLWALSHGVLSAVLHSVLPASGFSRTAAIYLSMLLALFLLIGASAALFRYLASRQPIANWVICGIVCVALIFGVVPWSGQRLNAISEAQREAARNEEIATMPFQAYWPTAIPGGRYQLAGAYYDPYGLSYTTDSETRALIMLFEAGVRSGNTTMPYKLKITETTSPSTYAPRASCAIKYPRGRLNPCENIGKSTLGCDVYVDRGDAVDDGGSAALCKVDGTLILVSSDDTLGNNTELMQLFNAMKPISITELQEITGPLGDVTGTSL